MNRLTATLAAAALVVTVPTVATADDPRNVCQRTDSGWALVPYDDANGSWTTAVKPYNGACPDLDIQGELRFVKPPPAPAPVVRTVTVVRTRVVTIRCVRVKRPGADRVRCVRKAVWAK